MRRRRWLKRWGSRARGGASTALAVVEKAGMREARAVGCIDGG